MTDSLWNLPHHDGSETYVPEPPSKPGGKDGRDTWLRADLPVVNPVVSYRWLLDGGPYGYQWLNGSGLHSHDVADAFDFRLSTYDPPPLPSSGRGRTAWPSSPVDCVGWLLGTMR